MDAEPSTPPPGFKPSDLLTLPPGERRLLQWLLRRGPASAEEAAGGLGLDPAEVVRLLEALTRRGAVESAGSAAYRPCCGSTRPLRGLPQRPEGSPGER